MSQIRDEEYKMALKTVSLKLDEDKILREAWINRISFSVKLALEDKDYRFPDFDEISKKASELFIDHLIKTGANGI